MEELYPQLDPQETGYSWIRWKHWSSDGLAMIDPMFVKECDAFLSSMNLDEQSFWPLIKCAHECLFARYKAYLL